VSKCFYGGRVANGDAQMSRWLKHGFTAPPEVKDNSIVWLDTPWAGHETAAAEHRDFSGGYYNALEARIVLGFLRRLLHGQAIRSLAIMSPYRAQVNQMRRLMADYHFPRVGALVDHLHTADSFQGKQADVAVVSLVRNNVSASGSSESAWQRGIGFLASRQRTTVVFSRAQRLLVVVGSLQHFRRFGDSAMADLASEIESAAATPKSGVIVVKGEGFLDVRHWSALERQQGSAKEPPGRNR
jgi:hypothetical protein